MPVKITYDEIKEIIIHEIVTLTEDMLIKSIDANKQVGNQYPPMYWVNGVIFNRHTYDHHHPKIMEDALRGVIHWAYVEYLVTKMETFAPVIQIGPHNVKLMDGSGNRILIGFAEDIKKRDRTINSYTV